MLFDLNRTFDEYFRNLELAYLSIFKHHIGIRRTKAGTLLLYNNG